MCVTVGGWKQRKRKRQRQREREIETGERTLIGGCRKYPVGRYIEGEKGYENERERRRVEVKQCDTMKDR